MNKIYRVVFNHATQSWTAVAEIARAKGKGSSTTVGSTEQVDAGSVSKLIRFTLVMSGMILSAQAFAATGTEYQAGTDNVCYFDTATNSVICGTATTQATGQNAVAVGESATANAIQVTSVGYNAGQGSTNAANSTFIGTGAGANSNGTAQGTQLTTAYNTYVGSDAGNGATGVQNTAVGGSNAGAGVTGDANAAFGHASLYNTKGNLNTGLGAYAGQNSSGDSNTSVGDNAGRKVTGNNNTALGSNAGTGTKGSDNVAIGVDAGQSITAAETVSIGKGAKANNYKAVALGSGAVTDVSVDTKEATVNGITYGNFAGSESIATVSVGSKDNERTITNVAAGRISATSTDAINGSQLYMVADKLGTLNTEIANTYFHVNNGSNKDTGDATTNLGRITDAAGAKNVGAVTAGMNAVAETSQSIAIGQGAKAGAADRTGSSNWANIIDPRTKNPFTSEAELLAYYETVKTNPGNTVTRALIGKINNIAIGAGAVAEGGRNISIGEFAGVGTADNWNIHNVNIGSEAGQNSKKDYSVAVGYRAGALTDAQQLVQEGVVDGGRHPSVLIGKQAGEGTVAYGTVAIGQDAGKNISDIRSIKNIAIGSGAGQAVSSNDGRNATFPGFGAGANTMIGAASGRGLVGDGNVAIGNLSGSGTTGDNNFFGGHLAGANGSSDRSIIIGSHAGEEITSDRSVFIGNYAHSEKKGNVVTGIAIGNNTLAGQNTDGSITYNSIAIGNSAAATNDNTIALGRSASASGLRSTAIGSGANSSGEQAIAIGRGAVASGAQSIAIGTENRVTANNAGAIGDPSIVAGAGSYTLGNDNAVGSTSTNVGAFGNNNQIGATATYDTNGKLLLASGLTDTAAVENSRAVGNKNYINTSNTYVLGSGVGTKDDGSVLGTVENSVYLGNDSTVAKGAAVGTKNLDKEGVAGTTTTAGDTGTVDTATVAGVTYSGFAGKTAAGAVSVGSAGLERRVMNVAAGEISATSTDAINGSQLYMVADKLGTLNTEIANTYFHVNNGSNKDTGDATTNLGRITDAAGAKNVGAVTAGMNAVAETSQSIAIGQGAKAGAADRTGSSNWANIIDPRTKNPFTSEAELLAYYETVKTNPANTVTRALIGKINNIAIGAGAVAEGGRNISIGEFAGVGTADNWNIQNVNIGTEAGQNSKKDYSVAIGYRAGALTEAQQLTQEAVLDAARHPSILIGKQSGEGSVAYGTVAMGAEAGKGISDVRSVHNIAIGRNAGQGVSSNDGRNATFGGFGAGANTLMGASAGRNLSGDGNVAIGNLTGQGTIGDNNIMMGHLAGSGSTTDRSIIMGNQTGWSTGTNDRNVLIGNFVNGGQKANVATAVGIGNNTIATGNSSVSIGNQAKATAVNSIAQGTQAVASGENAISIGAGTTFFGLAVQPNTASGEKSVAIGYANNVTGESAIAIGTQNKVSGANAGAIGDPSIVSGAGSYTLGNDNAVGSTSTNVGAFGNNNQIGATATYDANGKLLLASGLTDTAAVENARAVGNKNYINTSNTYVLGSGVGTKDDGSVLGTVENSVYLGNDSTVAKGAAVGTKNLTKEGAEGATTTAGDTGEVTSATVSGVTYGSFAGKTAAGAVSMGSAGLERRVMNVAAGEISATSTDAINGSQLYMVAQGTLDQMPVIYTDTNGNKLIKSPDGNFYPAGTVLDATGKPVDTTIQPVTNVIASMNDGDNIANTPKTLANVAGSLTPTYNKGDMTIGTDGKPTDTAAGGPTILQTGPKAEDAAKIYNNAATVGDLLNAGWNLQGNGSAQDFVKPYDTVNFADGTGTTVDVTTDDGKTSTIKVNVDAQSTVESAQTPVVYTNKEGDKLIKGDDGKFYPADSVKIGDNYYPAGTTEDENGNPVDANGDTVTALTPTGTGDIIASMNNGDNSTTAPMTLTNIASNLPNTYNKDAYNTAGEPVTTSQALPDNLNVNNAATVGDILNAGWNLQGNGTAKDFVKPYDTVNFADGTGTTVDVSTDEDGKVSTIKVNVDAQAVTNNSQLPVVYTDKDGKQVYPIVDEDGNVTYNTQPDGKGDVVAKGDVITSINGPEGTTTPTTLTNVASNLPNTYNNDAYNTGDAPVTTEQALPVDEQGNPTLNVNNAATVGDILNAGWNLQGNGTAKDFVKPYDTVNFADGTGTTVDVSTDEEGKVSTIKVNVDAQTVTNDSQLPVVYTDKNGNQVYPIVDDQGNVTYNTQPDGKGDTVDKGDVITSINGPDGTTTPTTLTNVASNLPNTYNTDVYNTTNQPVTVSQALPTGLNVNNAATVGDILNAGWNLQGNGVAKDFVKPYDTVNFVNGNATTATVETAADGKSSTVKYDVQVDGNTIKVVDGKLTAAADSNTVTGVTAGDNITVTSTTDASGNPTYTVATKKDVTFDSVTINNGPTINADGINMNGDKITNVADGDISPTSKDAVNGSQLYSAVNNINSNIAASKEEVTSNDKSVTVTTTKNASGSNVFDLSVNTDGTTITKNADGALTVNTTPLTNNIDGSVNTPAAPNAIATAGDVANAINNSGFTLTAQGSNGSLVKPGSTVDMNNTDGNIVISKSASDNKVTYNLAKDIKVDSVTTGNTVVNNSGVTINNADPAKTVSLTENGLNNGGNRITNVESGKDGTDAVNVNQLNQVNNNVVNLNNKVNRVDRDLRGGIAGANAAAALPQAYIPGKSMVAAAAGTYRGQSALAVGYSRISDNGKIILKLQGNTNTRGDIGGAIGVGYQW